MLVSSSQIKEVNDNYPCYVSFHKGAMRIMSIVKGSAIWNLGVRQGDEILRYNEQQFTDFCTLDQYQRQLTKSGEPFTIELKSGVKVTLSKSESLKNKQ